MIHKNLVKPDSIVVVGGSDNIHSPGGRVLKNLIDHNFKGDLFVVNPKNERIQGQKSFKDIHDLPNVDLAIISIAAIHVPEAVKVLTGQKNTRGFIIFSAGFSEKDQAGAQLEQEIVALINEVGGSLLGPNNIGLINDHYTGVFTTPIPVLDKNGVDFISGSGATAVFIIEAAASSGLKFSSVYTVGNSAQIGIEEILEYLDVTFDNKNSAKVKILYLESINKPLKFLKHALSLRSKGCRIAAIKAGSSKAGNRAASSHTGAMANSDVFIEALFEKAGVVRCFGRIELIAVAEILLQKELKGKNIAIITHAGGPAVMLTDVLSKNGLTVPEIESNVRKELLSQLYNGSSTNNPIDFLATGTAEQLEIIIDYCDNKFDNIDAMAVIFGSPGLSSVYDAYDVLDRKIKTCKKPIFPILPSVINVKDEIKKFIARGNIGFSDEMLFGNALSKVAQNALPDFKLNYNACGAKNEIRKIIDKSPKGYLKPDAVSKLLSCVGIKVARQDEVQNKNDLLKIADSISYPVVQKVIGPLHKSDVGGVMLNIKNKEELINSFDTLMKIDGAQSTLIQPMFNGIEIFIGAKKETNFPHIIMCGLGGIFVEVIKDISIKMTPITFQSAQEMILKLKSYPILKGLRGKKGIDTEEFAGLIKKVNDLLIFAPEIIELDINPLIASQDSIVAVDARIRV
jgi:acetyltransferase